MIITAIIDPTIMNSIASYFLNNLHVIGWFIETPFNFTKTKINFPKVLYFAAKNLTVL